MRLNYHTLSDEKLMARIQRGDTAAFDELYARYGKRLLYYFHRMLGGDEEKAQDFLQDLFLKIVEKPARFKRGHAFVSWLYTVAHNMCKNEYRKQSVRQVVYNDPDIDMHCARFDGVHPIEKACDERAFLHALMDELDELSADQRTTFLLRHQENCSIREIGQILNCSEGTIKSRLHHITRKLASRLRARNPLCG